MFHLSGCSAVSCHLTVYTKFRTPSVKGLYAKARSGALKNFTGIDSPYEPPLSPDLWIDVATCSAQEASDRIYSLLQ
jgi:adenylylsulfate kinase-like enzyme